MSTEVLETAFKGKTVLVTGHTGFKGAWLCEWLLMLGARVTGIALPPTGEHSLFDHLDLGNRLDHHIQDIRERQPLTERILATEPDFIFHLAAQPLVRAAYDAPVATYDTNVMGTVHLLDALRQLRNPCSVVIVTSDKCYENRDWTYSYREEDPLGGHDPYSASKACVELVTASYRQSFFAPGSSNEPSRIALASARAGNVVGSGDWAVDRIVPDCVRHLQREASIPVRHPDATRPWQHVLEPLSGYLWLAMKQREALEAKDEQTLQALCSAFNFGPALTSNRTVAALVEEVLRHWPGRWHRETEMEAPHEAAKLNLAWDKAFHLLNWRPVWSFEETIRRTIQGYRQGSESPDQVRQLVDGDIEAYSGER